MIAVCSVHKMRVQEGVLTTTSEIPGPLWLDPEHLPFRRQVIGQIRRGRKYLLQPHMIETTRDNRRETLI